MLRLVVPVPPERLLWHRAGTGHEGRVPSGWEGPGPHVGHVLLLFLSVSSLGLHPGTSAQSLHTHRAKKVSPELLPCLPHRLFLPFQACSRSDRSCSKLANHLKCSTRSFSRLLSAASDSQRDLSFLSPLWLQTIYFPVPSSGQFCFWLQFL